MPEDKEKKKSRVNVKIVEEVSNDDINKETGVENNSEDKIKEEVKEITDTTNKDENKKEVKESPSDKETLPTKSKKKMPSWLLFLSFVVGLSLGSGLIGGIFFYQSKVGKISFDNSKEETTPTIEPLEQEPTESPAPEATVDLSLYKVNILNGSGIKGEAGKVQELLSDLEFDEVATGNADSYQFQETEVSFKESVNEKVFDSLTETLEDYKLKLSDNLDDDSDYDIVITVGQLRN